MRRYIVSGRLDDEDFEVEVYALPGDEETVADRARELFRPNEREVEIVSIQPDPPYTDAEEHAIRGVSRRDFA